MANVIRSLVGLKPKRVQPPTVETDTILPVHRFDDSEVLRSMVLCWTLRFNDVLDADKLHDALARLLEVGEWRKLGGRLRLNENGRLEIHVPSSFTQERPAVRYTRVVYDLTVDEHPLASRLPKVTENASVQEGVLTFQSLSARPGAPSSVLDFLYSDEPQLSLHITSFADATLVSLSWPHTMTDAMGRVALVTAWSNMLAGRESEIPPLLGVHSDPLANVGTASDDLQEPFVLAPKRLTGFKLLIFVVCFVWELVWRPKIEARMIFLPAKFVAQLRQRVQDGFKSDSDSEKPPFISEGDILAAWATRLLASSRSSRPFTVISALDIRSRLTVFKPGETYVQNLALGTYTLLSSYEAVTAPLERVAAKFRQSIVEQTTDPQVRAFVNLNRKTLDHGGPPPIFGEPNCMLVIFSNWTKGRFLHIVDFSPAVIRSGDTREKRSNPPGTAIYQHSHPLVQSRSSRNVFNILGKDHDGNYWITGFLVPEDWSKIEQAITPA